MGNQQNVDEGRRNLLIAASMAGGVGGVVAAAPFVCIFAPSEKTRAADAPVEVDVSNLAPGQIKVVEWRGKPVWLLKRTLDMLESLKKTDSEVADPKSGVPLTVETPDYCENETRFRAEYKDLLIVVGICSHLGCSPSGPFPAGANVQFAGDPGFVCPCRGSTFDLAGRVFKSKPAPQNLDVPPYMFLSDTKLVIGRDEKGEV